MLQLVLGAVEGSGDELPLRYHFQEQVLVGVEEASSLCIEAHPGPTSFNALTEAILMEFICNLVE